MQRVLLRRVVNEIAAQRKLPHFDKIARTSGFLDPRFGFHFEPKRSETWPALH